MIFSYFSCTYKKSYLYTVMEALKQMIRPGRVYRRSELEFYSTAVDRHLGELTKAGVLKKLRQGLYYAPKESKFGPVPPEDKELVHQFLKDKNFLLLSPNAFNSLGLGTTQLYNVTWVYNHKRRGEFRLNGKVFHFKIKSSFPANLSDEFLVVDLLNNLDELAEDPSLIFSLLQTKIPSYNLSALTTMAQLYGTGETKQLIRSALRKIQKANGRLSA
jgi:hypothetical protein